MSSSIWTLLRVAHERNRQERSCRFSAEQLSAHQARALALLRQFVLARSPFYQRFHGGLEGQPLEALPILSKALLMEHFDELVTDRALHLADLEAFLSQPAESQLFRGRYVVLSTSGSTGRRGIFVFDSGEWIRAIAQISRPIAWQRAGERGRPPRSALIASSTWWHYSARVGMSLSSRLLPTLRIDAGTPLAEMVRQLNEWQPQALAAYPSVLRLLAEEQLSGRLRVTLRHIATSAELITARVRERVREAWGVPVRDTYGATEYAPIASECEQGNKPSSRTAPSSRLSMRLAGPLPMAPPARACC